MPEGPEIRLAADKIADALVGYPVKEIFFYHDALKGFENELRHSRVIAIETYGKAMLTRFENGLNIYSHNQLYGIWMIRNAFDYPETKRSLRLAIHNAKHSALLYSASDIEVLADHEVDHHPFIRRIGPDLLNPKVTQEEVEARFMAPSFKRRRLTTLLLDQGFLAGVGNYLRSEILFWAGVSPMMRPIDCTSEQIARLAEGALLLTRQSYKTKGITNDLDLVKQLKQEGYSRSQYRFRVFNRVGKSCFTCGTPIMKDMFGSRRLYWCPSCQPD